MQTSYGNLPTRRATCTIGKTLGDSWIDFDFEDSSSTDGDSDKLRRASKKRNKLESLAFLSDGAWRIDHALLERVAAQMGPVFGCNKRECVADWVSVSGIVRDVLYVQEVLNGNKPYKFLNEDTEVLIAKCRVTSTATRNSFAMYSYTASLCDGVTKALFNNMPMFPLFKKLSTDDVYEYAFFELSEDDCGKFITVTLLSFKHDITSLDFAVAIQAMGEFAGCWQFASVCRGGCRRSGRSVH